MAAHATQGLIALCFQASFHGTSRGPAYFLKVVRRQTSSWFKCDGSHRSFFHLLIVDLISQAAASSAVTVWGRRLGFRGIKQIHYYMANKRRSWPYDRGTTVREHAGANVAVFIITRADMIHVCVTLPLVVVHFVDPSALLYVEDIPLFSMVWDALYNLCVGNVDEVGVTVQIILLLCQGHCWLVSTRWDNMRSERSQAAMLLLSEGVGVVSRNLETLILDT